MVEIFIRDTIVERLDFIVEAEERLASSLKDRRQVKNFLPGRVHVGREWANTVWQVGLDTFDATTCERTEIQDRNFASRAVFVCGVHRSGTTLVRDLLDDHPALCVLPAEASYFGAMEHLERNEGWEARLKVIGGAWLLRLVNPINQPPYFLLGRSSGTGSPYVAFARDFCATATSLRDRGAPAPELSAVACAYARARGRALDQLAWWVDKTPLTERHLDRIARDFPAARFIHVLRDPDGAARSYYGLISRSNDDAAPMRTQLRDLAKSYAIARSAQRGGRANYMLVHYDALVADRAETMQRIARFLDIADDPALTVQTVAGLPAEPNSSRIDASQSMSLSFLDRALLAFARHRYRQLMRSLT